jgi:hypothetical protein
MACTHTVFHYLAVPCLSLSSQLVFSENIDFQFPMRKACEAEMKAYCADVPHGSARVIRCLQDNLAKKEFSPECKDEVRLKRALVCKRGVCFWCPGSRMSASLWA